MRDKVRTILKEWLQSKDDIVFTDDIAIEEVTDEIVEACRNIGKTPGNKGTHLSEESKIKISEKCKGQKRPKDENYRNKISEGLKRYHQNKNNENNN